jgi:hypothetical protein
MPIISLDLNSHYRLNTLRRGAPLRRLSHCLLRFAAPAFYYAAPRRRQNENRD